MRQFAVVLWVLISPLNPWIEAQDLPPKAVCRLGSTDRRHGGVVRSLAFSPNGSVVVSVGGDKALRVWNVRTGKQVRSWLARDGEYLTVAFSPKGDLIAAAGTGKMIEIYTPEGKEVGRLTGHTGSVNSVAFSPNGAYLASGAADKTVRLWDVRSERELARFNGHLDTVSCVAFLQKREAIISGSSDGTIRCWELDAHRMNSTLGRLNGLVRTMAVTPDERFVAASSLPVMNLLPFLNSKSTTMALVSLEKGRQEGPLPAIGGVVDALAVANDSRTVFSGGLGGQIDIWDLRKKQHVGSIDAHHLGIAALALSPRGDVLASGGMDGLVKFWDTTKRVEMYRDEAGHTTRVTAVQFLPDGRSVATGSDDRTIQTWNAKSGQRIDRIQLLAWVYHIAFLKQGRFMVFGRPIQVLRTRDKEHHMVGILTQMENKACRFSGDGKLFTSEEIRRDFKTLDVGIWSVNWDRDDVNAFPNFKRLHSLGKYRGRCYSFAFSPDKRVLAAGTGRLDMLRVQFGEISLWDVQSGEKLGDLSGHGDQVTGVDFSANGKWIYSSSFDGTILVSDWRAKETICRLADVKARILCQALSPDGRFLATGDANGLVRVWELATLTEAECFRGHLGSVNAVAFSPDGRLLVSGSSDTCALIWDVTGKSPAYASAPLTGASGNKGDAPLARGTRPSEKTRRKPLDESGMQRLWNDLSHAEASIGVRAVWEMVDNPDQASKFLGKQLKRAGEPNRGTVENLLKDLESDQFATRKAAQAKLERLAELAEPFLRRALEGNGSVESKKRIEALLARLYPIKDSDRLRVVRAIEALEEIGSAGAKRVLEELAKGAPQALSTQEAAAALGRLRRK